MICLYRKTISHSFWVVDIFTYIAGIRGFWLKILFVNLDYQELDILYFIALY